MPPVQHTLKTNYPVGPVHCYSTEVNGELILFDTGPPTEEAKEYLRTNLDLHKLKYVLLTHCHTDHYGLAAWLEVEYNATIFMPYRETLKVARRSEHLDGLTALLGDLGFSQQFMDTFRLEMSDDKEFPDFPQAFKIAEYELPAELGIQAVPCPAHSQSDMVYVAANWAVTGDTMLRNTFQTPLLDFDLLTGRRFSNYNAYCATIVTLATLRDKLILPGHRDFIFSVDNSIFFYTEKLLDRAKQSRLFSSDLTVPQIVKQMLGDVLGAPFLNYFKASEIVFIRDFLTTPQTLKRSLEAIGLYPQLAEAFEQAVGEDNSHEPGGSSIVPPIDRVNI